MEEQEWLLVSSEDVLGNVHKEVVRAPFHLSGEGMDSETWLKVLKFANEIKNGNNEFAFFDIVDGKQRLKALADFINDVFPDKNGKYFSDFSILGRRFFYNKLCFTFAKLDERTTDEDVLKVFLLVNNSGKQMTQEHLEYVDSILKQL